MFSQFLFTFCFKSIALQIPGKVLAIEDFCHLHFFSAHFSEQDFIFL